MRDILNFESSTGIGQKAGIEHISKGVAIRVVE
jgi:hypothetical protein